MGRILPLAVVAAILMPIAAQAAEVKIGYVDLQRALNEVEEGQTAKARLKAKFERSQAQLDQEQASLKARREELDKKRLAMDEATLRQKAEELDKEFVRVSGLYSKLQKELSDEEREATAQIFKKMRTLIADMAEKQGFTYVLEMNESGLLYGPPSLDLTNELVRAYNAANRSAKK
ncbi:MAG TPA: OmpH family outer membrane protein [Vulgatibacter sp.]|nr:OmpH family outer membrane protein [Vulgatibacter sp.]